MYLAFNVLASKSSAMLARQVAISSDTREAFSEGRGRSAVYRNLGSASGADVTSATVFYSRKR